MLDIAKGFVLTLGLLVGVVFVKSEITRPPVLTLRPGDPAPAALVGDGDGRRDEQGRIVLALRAEHCFTCTLPTAALRRIQADTTLSPVPIVGLVVGGNEPIVQQLFQQERLEGTVVGLSDQEHHRDLDGARLPILLVLREDRVALVQQFDPGSNANLDPGLAGELRDALTRDARELNPLQGR